MYPSSRPAHVFPSRSLRPLRSPPALFHSHEDYDGDVCRTFRPPSPPLPLCCTHRPHSTLYRYLKTKPHHDSKTKRLPAQSPVLSASRLIPSSVHSIPLTLPPPRFDALAFAMPYTTHALMPPRRDFVAYVFIQTFIPSFFAPLPIHSASALPSPCSRPPANVVLRPRQWSGSPPLMQPPRVASLLAHCQPRPRLPPTSHTTSLATTSIRRCASEACMPSPRCSRPAARLSSPPPAPDAVPPARVATTHMAARLTCYATAVMSKSPHLPATVFPTPDYDHPRHATPARTPDTTRTVDPMHSVGVASLVAHVVPVASSHTSTHPQSLLPIPHDPVFTFSPATSNFRTIPPPLEAAACHAPPKRCAPPVTCATVAAAIFHHARPLRLLPTPGDRLPRGPALTT
ncbi:hypothetical protein B0H13DRAFT_2551351 [Mycena leptocephala]|nr:hypothetical protein B0H13DRAFT_2551351 [Mycena leptocephala]